MRIEKTIKITVVLSLLIALQCGIYDPKPQIQPTDNGVKNESQSSGTVYAINRSAQTCNPSIAPSGPYNGCMLWLNFGGDLNVVVPPANSGYKIDRVNVRQHDRLSISDTANTIRWYVMRDELGISGQIQDPRWSVNPDYIACLGDEHNDGKWCGYVVRISDKKYCKVSENNLDETSTPYLWVPRSAVAGSSALTPSYSSDRGGFIDTVSIKTFFGTDNVKLVYNKVETGQTLYFIDYSSNSIKPVRLEKPKDRSDWDCESPQISPDGNWIVYNCIGSGVYESYIQQLKTNSVPVLIAKNAADPHWWIHPEFKTTYIVYCEIKGDYFSKSDYTDPSFELNGTLGSTWKQEVAIASGDIPGHAAFEMTGTPSMIVNLPFKGGISADGRYLCTGYGDAYIMSLK